MSEGSCFSMTQVVTADYVEPEPVVLPSDAQDAIERGHWGTVVGLLPRLAEREQWDVFGRIQGLGRQRANSVLNAIVKLPEPGLRGLACWALGQVGGRRAITLLLHQLFYDKS